MSKVALNTQEWVGTKSQFLSLEIIDPNRKYYITDLDEFVLSNADMAAAITTDYTLYKVNSVYICSDDGEYHKGAIYQFKFDKELSEYLWEALTVSSAIDTELSLSSTNPVQNKIIAAALNEKASKDDIVEVVANPELTGNEEALSALSIGNKTYKLATEIDSPGTLPDNIIEKITVNGVEQTVTNGTADISLSPVALSGSYSDLNNRPTKLSEFTNDQNFATQSDIGTATQDLASITFVNETVSESVKDLTTLSVVQSEITSATSGLASTEYVDNIFSQSGQGDIKSDTVERIEAVESIPEEFEGGVAYLVPSNTSDGADIQPNPEFSPSDPLLTSIKIGNDVYRVGEEASEVIVDTELSITSVNPVQNKAITTKINEVESIAKGANQAKAFESIASVVSELKLLDSTALNVGQNILIRELNVPDLWIESVNETFNDFQYTTDEEFVNSLENPIYIGYYGVSRLETQKVDLTDYATKSEVPNIVYSETEPENPVEGMIWLQPNA